MAPSGMWEIPGGVIGAQSIRIRNTALNPPPGATSRSPRSLMRGALVGAYRLALATRAAQRDSRSAHMRMPVRCLSGQSPASLDAIEERLDSLERRRKLAELETGKSLVHRLRVLSRVGSKPFKSLHKLSLIRTVFPKVRAIERGNALYQHSFTRLPRSKFFYLRGKNTVTPYGFEPGRHDERPFKTESQARGRS